MGSSEGTLPVLAIFVSIGLSVSATDSRSLARSFMFDDIRCLGIVRHVSSICDSLLYALFGGVPHGDNDIDDDGDDDDRFGETALHNAVRYDGDDDGGGGDGLVALNFVVAVVLLLLPIEYH